MKKLVLISLIFAMVCSAEEFNAEMLMQKVESADSNELIAIVEQGKKDSNRLDSYSLIILSMASLKSEDYLNTELFLYQALLRAAVDKEVYTPTETGGNSPLLALMALRQQISFVLIEADQKTSEDYQYLIDSLKSWKPKCEDKYSPGWDYEVTPDLELCQTSFDEVIEKNVKDMNKNKALYSHPEYFTLLKQWRDLTMASMFSESGEPDTELMNLQDKLIEIENVLGVNGEVTQSQLISSLEATALELYGEWKLYKDDDFPNKEDHNEVISFWTNRDYCIEGIHNFDGKYDLEPNSISLLSVLEDKIIMPKRDYKLKDNILKLKNRKVGWAYYKKINDTPNENCFDELETDLE